MSSVTLYGLAHMTYVRTPRMVLEEKGVAYDIVPVKPGSEALKRLHPFMRMPILKHGDLVLYESNAITQYIEEAFDGPSLVPEAPVARALMRKWMNNVDSYYYPTLMRGIVFPRIIHPKRGVPVDEEAVKAALGQLPHYLDVVEADLKNSDFLAGDMPSLADFALLPNFDWLEMTDEGRKALEGRDRLNAWTKRMRERPSHQATEAELPD